MKTVNFDRALLMAVDDLLSEHAAGMSEYELMTELDARYGDLYPKPDWQDKLTLFRHHFLLRHTLYVLQRELAEQPSLTRWTLDINAVQVQKRLADLTSGDAALPAEHDPLAEYYLDLNNMAQETEQSVQSLLDDFWTAMARYQIKPDALKTLGLKGDESLEEQKRQYRQLAQQHHPDKGGDAEAFQAIQEAWEQLKP